jgi:ribonuclease VapC
LILVETSGQRLSAVRADLEAFLNLLAPKIVAFTSAQAEIPIDAFRGFGKGRHRAGLNIGDCFRLRPGASHAGVAPI